MVEFDEFITVCGKNAGYRPGQIPGLLHVSKHRLKEVGPLKLEDIKRIRDTLDIPEYKIEKYVIGWLRNGLENKFKDDIWS